LKTREKLNEINNKIAKRDNQIRLYGRAKEGYDREDMLNSKKKYVENWEGNDVKIFVNLEGNESSKETNQKRLEEFITTADTKVPNLVDENGNEIVPKNAYDKLDKIMSTRPDYVREMKKLPHFENFTTNYYLNKTGKLNVLSVVPPTKKEYEEAMQLLELDKLNPLMPNELRQDALDIESAYRQNVPVSALRVKGATKGKSIGAETAKIIQNNPKLSSLDYRQQRAFSELYKSNLEMGISPALAEKRAAEHISKNVVVGKGIVVKQNKDVSKLNPHSLVKVKVKGVGGGEKDVDVFEIIEELAKRGEFNNRFGLKDGTKRNTLGAPFVSISDLKDIVEFSLDVDENGNNVLMITSTVPNGDVIIIQQDKMEKVALLHSARTRSYQKVEPSAGGFGMGFTSESLRTMGQRLEKEIEEQSSQLEIVK